MIEIELKIKIEVPPREISNPLPNTVRGDGVFHGLAGKFFQGGASEDAVGREHQ
jgi:hypothetical protein